MWIVPKLPKTFDDDQLNYMNLVREAGNSVKRHYAEAFGESDRLI